MKTRIGLLIAGVLLGIPSPTPARVAGEGCVAAGTHVWIPQQPWLCRYTATGPSVVVVSTTNPFVVNVEGTGAPASVRRSRPGPPTAFVLSTVQGNTVEISISCWNYPANAPCVESDGVGGRDGIIAAHSRP